MCVDCDKTRQHQRSRAKYLEDLTHEIYTQSSTESRSRREAHDKSNLLVTFGIKLKHSSRSPRQNGEQVGKESEESLWWRIVVRVGVTKPLEDGDAVRWGGWFVKGRISFLKGGGGKEAGQGAYEIAPSKLPARNGNP